jgi:Icc-related predicted phosphoesterase
VETKKLIIDILSDTHNRHDKFICEGGDILIHSGDFTGRGTPMEVEAFMLWLEKQEYKYKIVIPGNHDWNLESNFDVWKEEFAKRGIVLLNDSGIEIEGIKIWGSPVQPWFHSWAFNRHRTEEGSNTKHPWIKPHWDLIPEDTEILITHGPPHGILDLVARSGGLHVGCEHLAKRIVETQIKLHVFGHIHEGRGFEYDSQTTYVNGSSLDENYFPSDNKPMRTIREICEDGSIVYVL